MSDKNKTSSDSFLTLCKTCDYIVNIPNQGVKHTCHVCSSNLKSRSLLDFKQLGFFALSALIILIISIFQPFISVSSLGITHTIELISMVFILKTDWSLLLYFLFLFTFMLPVIMLLIQVAIGLFNVKPNIFIANIYTISHAFCMVDVFILAVLVSLIKLTSLSTVDFHSGFILALIFSIMLVLCWAKCHPYKVWDLISQSSIQSEHKGLRGIDVSLILCRHCHNCFYNSDTDNAQCPRCGTDAAIREKHYFQRVMALLLASIILYLPSNLYPIMFTDYLGNNTGSNIIEGVISLWNMNSQFVAIIILVASIFIPIFKILSMAFLLYVIRFRTVKRPIHATRLYKIVCFIGKWSMIDVFVVIIMTSVVRFTGVMVINPGFAVISFCLVVIITMFAAESFDQRLIWDNNINGSKKS